MTIESIALLFLSILALGVGPVVSHGLRRRHWFWAALDAFVLFTVGGFVLLHVLPHSMEEMGWSAIAVAVVGFLAPLLLSKLHAMTERKAQSIALILALVGLMGHAALDGMTLALSGTKATAFSALAIAVLVHRLPMGLAIWLLVRSLLGTTWAVVMLGGMGLATAAGFVMAGSQMLGTENVWVAGLQALVGGMLLHVLLHHPQDPEDEEPVPHRRWKWPEFVGAALGLGLVVFFPEAPAHAHAEHPTGLVHYGSQLLQLALTSAPALLLGYALAGLLPVVFPKASLAWLRRGSPVGQVSKGVLFGLPLPICSCGVVPLYQGLIRRGVPATAAMAFLVATPELGVESLVLSVPLLGGTLTGMRLASAFVVAMAVGWFVGRRLPMPAEPQPDEAATSSEKMNWKGKVRRAWHTGFVEILDDTAPWILVGLLVAAALQPASLSSWLAVLPAGTDVLLFAVVGIPIYVCASGATPLAAALIFAGVSPGAAIAFLLAGPATNVTTFGVLSRLHSARIAALFGLSVIALAIGLGYLTNVLVGGSLRVPLHSHAHGTALTLQWICLAILSVAFLLSVLRQGVRPFLLSIFSSGDSSAEPHEHEHEHADHEHAEAPLESPEAVAKAAESSCCCGPKLS